MMHSLLGAGIGFVSAWGMATIGRRGFSAGSPGRWGRQTFSGAKILAESGAHHVVPGVDFGNTDLCFSSKLDGRWSGSLSSFGPFLAAGAWAHSGVAGLLPLVGALNFPKTFSSQN